MVMKPTDAYKHLRLSYIKCIKIGMCWFHLRIESA